MLAPVNDSTQVRTPVHSDSGMTLVITSQSLFLLWLRRLWHSDAEFDQSSSIQETRYKDRI